MFGRGGGWKFEEYLVDQTVFLFFYKGLHFIDLFCNVWMKGSCTGKTSRGFLLWMILKLQFSEEPCGT